MKKKLFNVVAMLAFVALIATGCGSSKNVSVLDKKAMKKTVAQGFKIVEDLPCRGIDSNEEYIIVNGEGRSKDRTMAKDKAYLAALENLSSKLSGVASKGTERVAVSTEVDNEDFHAKTVNTGKTIAQANVSGYRTSCEKFVVYDDGSYGCFIAIEFGKQKIVKQMYESLSRDKMIRADYDFDKYMKEFEADLKEYEEQNK